MHKPEIRINTWCGSAIFRLTRITYKRKKLKDPKSYSIIGEYLSFEGTQHIYSNILCSEWWPLPVITEADSCKNCLKFSGNYRGICKVHHIFVEAQQVCKYYEQVAR